MLVHQRVKIPTRRLRGDDQMFQHAEGKAQVLLLGRRCGSARGLMTQMCLFLNSHGIWAKSTFELVLIACI